MSSLNGFTSNIDFNFFCTHVITRVKCDLASLCTRVSLIVVVASKMCMVNSCCNGGGGGGGSARVKKN